METVIIIACAIAIFSLQLLLCYKIKNPFLKLLPAFVATAFDTYFFIMMKIATSWDALGYALLWILSLIALAAITLAWIVSTIIYLIRRK